MIRAVLFDLDGTLADTAPDLGYALNQLLLRYGKSPLSLPTMRPHASAGSRGLLWVGFGITPASPEYDAMRQEYLDCYAENLCRRTVLFAGVGTLLDALETQRLRWGIVTNKPERFTTPLVRRLGLFDRAATVVSGDTCTRAKPYPDSLLKAASDIALAGENILYVGDDERDVQAAHAAGIGSIVAGYGYLGTDNHPDRWGADGIVQRPEEILKFL
jgi:N-acetyl-D-muramate 6-phosphate phosphatase